MYWECIDNVMPLLKTSWTDTDTQTDSLNSFATASRLNKLYTSVRKVKNRGIDAIHLRQNHVSVIMAFIKYIHVNCESFLICL